MPNDNQYKLEAQKRKCSAMVEAIDKAALAQGIDPHSEPLRIWRILNQYSDRQWFVVDSVAKLKTPSSDETRDLVKDEYKRRIK